VQQVTEHQACRPRTYDCNLGLHLFFSRQRNYLY
jgi:hypothetical protein